VATQAAKTAPKPSKKSSRKETREKLAAAVKNGATKATQAAAPAAPATSKEKPAPADAKREIIPDDAKLTALFEKVPGKPGTLAHRTRALYVKAKTVGEWREAARAADADLGYLHGDIRRGLIRIG